MAANPEKEKNAGASPVPETPLPGEAPKPWEKTTYVGKALPRVDAYERVSGSAVYPSDVRLPNMLYGAILGCPHPNARVRRLDTGKAEKMPGVRAVIGGSTLEADLKWSYRQGRPPKEVAGKIFDPHCRFEGDAVAAVAAETPHQAWDALRAITVEYEVLPFVADERKALQSGAPLVRDEGNLVQTEKYERGDVAKGFAEAAVVLEETYRTACEIHTPMELHGCVAQWDGDRLTLWESTQGVFSIQSEIAAVLGLPLSKVRVIGHYMGGGFGSKLIPGKYTAIAALLARRAGRPVKLFLTREQTYLTVGNRPPCNMRLKAGVKKDGTLTALEFSVLATGGAYPAGGSSLVDWQIRDLYNCPNVRIESTDAYVNAGPARPFRAPGHPQGSWALEQMMDALAKSLKIDPVDLRLKNIPTVSQAREGQPPYVTTGLKQCLDEGARAFGWKEAWGRAGKDAGKGNLRRGVGMASGLWVVGGANPPSTVIIRMFSDGSVNLNMGASDLGTGTKTVMAGVAAEELGVAPESIQIENADTGTTQYTRPSGGSKTVPTEAPTVRAAAVHVKQQLLSMAAEELKADASDLTFMDGSIVSRSDGSKNIKISALAGLKKRAVIVGIGSRDPDPAGKIVNPFAAQFCEVEVNMKTGEVKILRFLGAHDSGRVMNRLTYDSQVIGGITMGIGLAATESRVLDGATGRMLNRNWHDYKLPTALDVPAEMVSLPLEILSHEINTTGSKGLGEPVTIPTAAAVANAVYDATGIRVTTSPITPMELCRLLAERPKEGLKS
ncbi:MAG: xanthine dehydrogenase family protein molybdopterin-binding subunit [Syntrophobacteraceae bacterium]